MDGRKLPLGNAY